MVGTTSDMTTLTMSYLTDHDIFRICLEEGGIFTTVDITSLISGDDYDDISGRSLINAYKESKELYSLIFRSEVLKEVIFELLEVNGVTSITLAVNKKSLSKPTKGTVASCVLTFPSNSNVFISYNYQALRTASWTFSVSTVYYCMRPVTSSKEMCLRVNEEGIACVQHQIPLDDASGSSCFVDFIMVPDEII
jgi:hypothetical protein